MRNADGPMSTPRRPPPRSRGTPIRCTGFIAGILFRPEAGSRKPDVCVGAEPVENPPGDGPRLSNAIGDSDGAEAAAGAEEPWMRVEPRLDGTNTCAVADHILWALARPARHPRSHRVTRDPEHLAEIVCHQPRQSGVVVPVEPIGVAAPAEESSKQHVTGRRAPRPLRRH